MTIDAEHRARLSKPRRSRLRGTIAAVAVAAALVATTAAWLGSSGATGPTITPPAGLSSTGNVANVTTLSSSVTRTNGNAHLQTGVAIARLDVQKDFTTKIRVDINWTNASDAAKILNNPNAQLSIGLYHPIHTGNCNSSSAGSTVTSPLVNVTDSDGDTYCMALDEGASGTPNVSSTGKLLLAQNAIAGYLLPAATLASSPSDCAPSSSDTDVYCQPASAGAVSGGKRSLYVVTSITTPGGVPQGQVATLSTLSFYVNVDRVG